MKRVLCVLYPSCALVLRTKNKNGRRGRGPRRAARLGKLSKGVPYRVSRSCSVLINTSPLLAVVFSGISPLYTPQLAIRVRDADGAPQAVQRRNCDVSTPVPLAETAQCVQSKKCVPEKYLVRAPKAKGFGLTYPHHAILPKEHRARVDGRATARLHGIIERAVRCVTVKLSGESASSREQHVP